MPTRHVPGLTMCQIPQIDTLLGLPTAKTKLPFGQNRGGLLNNCQIQAVYFDSNAAIMRPMQTKLVLTLFFSVASNDVKIFVNPHACRKKYEHLLLCIFLPRIIHPGNRRIIVSNLRERKS